MKPRQHLFIGIALCFLIYLVFQLRLLIFPPMLELSWEGMRQIPAGEEIEVRGKTDTLSRVFINGDSIPLDREGAFSQQIVVQRGSNRIEVRAENRFGRERVKRLTIIGQAPAL